MADPTQEATAQKATIKPIMNGPDVVTMKDLLFIWKNNNYYNGVNKRKTFDVVIGAIWTIATIFLQMASMNNANAYGQNWFGSIIPVALFFVWGAAAFLSGMGKRKYLFMGLMFIPAFGLLFFGTCLLTLSANAAVGITGIELINFNSGPSMMIATILVGLISLGILIYGISKSIKRGN